MTASVDLDKLGLQLSDEETDDLQQEPPPADYEDALLADDTDDNVLQIVSKNTAPVKTNDSERASTFKSCTVTKNSILRKPETATTANAGKESIWGEGRPSSTLSTNSNPRAAEMRSVDQRNLVEYADVESNESHNPIANLRHKLKLKKNFRDLDYPSSLDNRKNRNAKEQSLLLQGVRKAKERLNRVEANRFFSSPKIGDEAGMRSKRAHEKTQEKMRMGLQSLVEVRDDNQNESVAEDEGADLADGASIPTEEDNGSTWFVTEPWVGICHLINKGYNIYWAIFKLKDDEPPRNLAGRLIKCVVSYKDISGVCEAPHRLQAKQGAAADFLKKFVDRFPMTGSSRFSTEVDPVLLIEPGILKKLVDRLTVMHQGMEIRPKFRYFVEQKESGLTSSCTLFIASRKFQACAAGNQRIAKILATKAAYEELLGETCPTVRIFQGEDCNTPEYLYRGQESEIIHCYDFSNATVLEPGNVRDGFSKRNNHGFGGRGGGRRVLVSYEHPEMDA